MTSNESIQYLQQRMNGKIDDRKNSDDINHRRSSGTHATNFRKAVYRSLALLYAGDEYQSTISYAKYCLKIFLACVFILIIGSLINHLWWFNRR